MTDRSADSGGAEREPVTEPSREARLGRLEYLLLALIALGVAITIAVAIVNPPG